MNLRDIVLKNKKMEHDHKEKFQELFGISLHSYMDTFTGFDIIKFDKDIGTPDEISMADFLEQKYGLEAKELVKNLL